MTTTDNFCDASYSPDDNKLRLYAATRLDAETYRRAKAAGYRWAPKQELFVCPRWTPQAEDLALELAGDIVDEDMSLVERAEARAERFEGYSERREREGDAAQAAVAAIAEGIPFGQPILVGHHSEKRARKDAERIERGMRKALRLFDTAEYWTQRAAGAIRAAKYKERPQVRARRIKTLEAERRKRVAAYTPQEPRQECLQEPWCSPRCKICGRDRYAAEACEGHAFGLDPTRPPKTLHVWAGSKGSGHWVEVSRLPAIETAQSRWIAHLDKRLSYERAMLEAEGATNLLDKPKRRSLPPLLNYRSAEPLQSRNEYRREEIIGYRQVAVTKAQLAKVPSDYKGTRPSLDSSHRFRIASARSLGVSEGGKSWDYVAVFLTDSKVHDRPEGSADAA